MDPVLQFKSAVSGVTVFEDLDKTTVFYLPTLVADPLKDQLLGTKHILQGGGAYGLTAAQLAALKGQFPNKPLSPADCRSTLADPFGELLKNHTYRLALLPQIPFPKLLFSATLDTAAADYQLVLQALQAGWPGMLAGQLLVTTKVRDVELLFESRYDNLRIKALRESKLAPTGLTDVDVALFIDEMISTGEIAINTPLGGSKARAAAVQDSFDRARADHFVVVSGLGLDDGRRVPLYDQQGVRPGDPITRLRGVRSTVHDIDIQV